MNLHAANPRSLTVGQKGALACLWEVSAPKPGNVHRGADFEDCCFADFVTSAIAIASSLDRSAGGGRLGEVVLAAVSATRSVVSCNTNLGLILLLVPLAMCHRARPLADAVRDVLGGLTSDDARLVYEAIRLAGPGGMGKADQHDLAGEPPSDLIVAMRLAADRDSIARQYTGNFADVLQTVAPNLAAGIARGWPLCDAIVHTHVRTLADFPDSLIARKSGPAVADEASRYAREVLASGGPGDTAYNEALADLDFWLRSDGRRRNPGTTADLIGAALFALLLEEKIPWPLRWQ